jgi:hypothetical protein
VFCRALPTEVLRGTGAGDGWTACWTAFLTGWTLAGRLLDGFFDWLDWMTKTD